MVPADKYFDNLNELEPTEQSIIDGAVEKMLAFHKGLEILNVDWNHQEKFPNYIQYLINFKNFHKCLQFIITTGELIVMLYDGEEKS